MADHGHLAEETMERRGKWQRHRYLAAAQRLLAETQQPLMAAGRANLRPI
jgi:hypothetical protein